MNLNKRINILFIIRVVLTIQVLGTAVISYFLIKAHNLMTSFVFLFLAYIGVTLIAQFKDLEDDYRLRRTLK